MTRSDEDEDNKNIRSGESAGLEHLESGKEIKPSEGVHFNQGGSLLRPREKSHRRRKKGILKDLLGVGGVFLSYSFSSRKSGRIWDAATNTQSLFYSEVIKCN